MPRGGGLETSATFGPLPLGALGIKPVQRCLWYANSVPETGICYWGKVGGALLGWWKNTRGHQLGPRRTRQLIALRCAVELLVNFLEFLAKQPCHQYQQWRASKDSRILFVNCDQFFVGFEVVVWHLLAYASECLDKMEAGGGEFSL
jgi:hypothetical protein